eukprot:8852198-Pyramimonas_sp.AAC.1
MHPYLPPGAHSQGGTSHACEQSRSFLCSSAIVPDFESGEWCTLVQWTVINATRAKVVVGCETMSASKAQSVLSFDANRTKQD